MIPVKAKDTLWQSNRVISISNLKFQMFGGKLFENMCWCQFWNKFDSRVDHTIVRNFHLLAKYTYLTYIWLFTYT